jgi:hypothetical protein
MASLRDQFEHFYAPDEDAEKTAFKTGLVTPDTNVLLNLYRFQARPRDELFGALEKLGERLWIPHQVGLEFHRRRLNVIAEQERYFNDTRKDFKALVDNLRSRVETFGTRIVLDKDRIRAINERIGSLQELLTAEVSEAGKANLVRLQHHDSDEVLTRLESLLDSRVGEPMRPRKLKAARKEAKRRAAAQLPPGYRDSGKADPTGDYLIFRQLMDEAKERKLPVVFITDDEKPDWYRREYNIPLGPRYELREEMMAEAGVPFVIMTTERFLRYAETYLNAEVSAETVDQAKELPGIVEDDLRIEAIRDLITNIEDPLQRTLLLSELHKMWVTIENTSRSNITALAQVDRDLIRRDLEVVRAKLDKLQSPMETSTARAQAALELSLAWERLLKYHRALTRAQNEQSSPEEDEQE